MLFNQTNALDRRERTLKIHAFNESFSSRIIINEHCTYTVSYSLDSYEPRCEKTGFCICENKDADQLRGNREADQHLCFRYTDTTIPLLYKFEISSFWPYSVAVQPGLCGTWSETLKNGFLTTRLIFPLIL